jgi:hypothetical protein
MMLSVAFLSHHSRIWVQRTRCNKAATKNALGQHGWSILLQSSHESSPILFQHLCCLAVDALPHKPPLSRTQAHHDEHCHAYSRSRCTSPSKDPSLPTELRISNKIVPLCALFWSPVTRRNFQARQPIELDFAAEEWPVRTVPFTCTLIACLRMRTEACISLILQQVAATIPRHSCKPAETSTLSRESTW